jgi:hypothetical protein
VSLRAPLVEYREAEYRNQWGVAISCLQVT